MNNIIKESNFRNMEPVSEDDYIEYITSVLPNNINLYFKKKYKNTCVFNYQLKFVDNKFNKKDVKELIKFIKQCDKNFVIVHLYIEFFKTKMNSSSGHANMLIFNNKYKTIEHFEPHGEKSDILIKEINMIGNLINYKIVDFVCPNIQQLQMDENEELKNDPGGFCLAWSLWYTDIRLSQPDKSVQEIINEEFKNLQKQKSFTTFIRSYSKFILKMQNEIQKYHDYYLDLALKNNDLVLLKKILNNGASMLISNYDNFDSRIQKMIYKGSEEMNEIVIPFIIKRDNIKLYQILEHIYNYNRLDLLKLIVRKFKPTYKDFYKADSNVAESEEMRDYIFKIRNRLEHTNSPGGFKHTKKQLKKKTFSNKLSKTKSMSLVKKSETPIRTSSIEILHNKRYRKIKSI